MEKLKKYIPTLSKIALILVIFVSIFLLSHSVLLSPDDYNYTFVAGSSNGERVTSLSACIASGKYFYNNWTGRVIPHVLIGIFRNLNSFYYEIANSIIFIIFIVMISKVLNKKAGFFSILSVFGYFAFSKMFGEKFGWISGSFNYLWPCATLSIFIYAFYKYFTGEKELSTLKLVLLSLYAFVSGFMHENTAFVGGAFLICLFLFNIKKFLKFENKKKIFVIAIIILFGIGGLLNIFAPGNLYRMDYEASGFSWNFLQNYKDSKKLLLCVFYSIISTFVIQNFKLCKKESGISVEIPKIKLWNVEEIKIQFLYFILPALIATIPMAVISYFPPRAFLAYEVMFTIVLARNVNILAEAILKINLKKLKFVTYNEIAISILAVSFTLIIFGHYSPSTLAQVNYIIPYKQKVTAQYEEAVKNGEKDVIVSAFDYINWIHREDYINIDNFFPELNWKMPVNALISQYYGFTRITAVSDSDYLIEVNVDTEGINPYEVIEKSTGRNIYFMEYDSQIRFTIPKEKLGEYVLDFTENGLKDKILNYSVRYVGGDATSQISLEQIVMF